MSIEQVNAKPYDINRGHVEQPATINGVVFPDDGANLDRALAAGFATRLALWGCGKLVRGPNATDVPLAENWGHKTPSRSILTADERKLFQRWVAGCDDSGDYGEVSLDRSRATQALVAQIQVRFPYLRDHFDEYHESQERVVVALCGQSDTQYLLQLLALDSPGIEWEAYSLMQQIEPEFVVALQARADAFWGARPFASSWTVELRDCDKKPGAKQ
jgi:hypothetical protein